MRADSVARRRRKSSLRAEDSDWIWTCQFVLFYDERHLDEMGYIENRGNFGRLVDRDVAASTLNENLNALVFLCESVHGRSAGE